MQSEPSSGIKLTAYSCVCWLFHRIYYDARNHKHKITFRFIDNKVGICEYVHSGICNKLLRRMRMLQSIRQPRSSENIAVSRFFCSSQGPSCGNKLGRFNLSTLNTPPPEHFHFMLLSMPPSCSLPLMQSDQNFMQICSSPYMVHVYTSLPP